MYTIRHAILLGALAASAGCLGADPSGIGGSGEVLDWSTHQPVAGARVVLTCLRPHWLQPEGEVIVRTVPRTTDAAGRYSFSRADQAGCARIVVGAAKQGYATDFTGPSLFNGRITAGDPNIHYLVKDSDAVWAELQRITPAPGAGLTDPDGRTSMSGTYMLWFSPFVEARRIASTPRELAFVHEHYCAKLRGLYARLTETDREHVARFTVTPYSFRGKTETGGTIDYAEVATYCGNAVTAAPPPAIH